MVQAARSRADAPAARSQTPVLAAIFLGLLAAGVISAGSSVLAAPPSSLLAPESREALLLELRRNGMVPEDLGAARRFAAEQAGDKRKPEELPPAERLLRWPLWMPDYGAHVAEVLARDLSGPAGRPPPWDGFFRLVREEWQVTGTTKESDDPCADRATSLRGGAGLVDRHAAWLAGRGETLGKGEIKALKTEIAPEVDAAAGRLMGEGLLARCRVDAAFRDVSTVDRDGLVAAALAEDVLGHEPPDWLPGVDRALLLRAGEDWARAVSDAAVALAGVDPLAWPHEPRILATELGAVWLGSPGNNSGSGDPFLLLDPGGDDHWRIAVEQREKPTARDFLPVRAWIDLGGDDAWQGGDVSFGGALLGVAAGIEAAGDDSYRAGRIALGAAQHGVATWLDAGGKDQLRVEAMGEGWASAGVGVLRLVGATSEGDVVAATEAAQGAATRDGVALLHGGLGDDHYALAPSGLGGQAWASTGGVAWLVDEAGDDACSAGTMAQGACTNEGTAILLDRSGVDGYLARGPSQGHASGSCAAALLDAGGIGHASRIPAPSTWSRELGVGWLLLDHAASNVWPEPGSAADSPWRSGVRIGDSNDEAVPPDRRAPAVHVAGGWGPPPDCGPPPGARDYNGSSEALQLALRDRQHAEPSRRLCAWYVLESLASSVHVTLDPADRAEWEAAAVTALQSDATLEVREVAASLLESVGSPGSAQPLGESLATAGAPLRSAAEFALLAISARSDGLAVARAVFPLAERAALPPTREAALRLLGATRHKEAWEVIEPALRDPDPFIRVAAALGAARLGGKRADEALLAMQARERDPFVLDALSSLVRAISVEKTGN